MLALLYQMTWPSMREITSRLALRKKRKADVVYTPAFEFLRHQYIDNNPGS